MSHSEPAGADDPAGFAVDRPDAWSHLLADDRPVLVLDFDGTVCVGDAPVWAYADAVIDRLRSDNTPDADDVSTTIRRELAAFLDGAPRAAAFADGYAAVATLAAEAASPDQLGAAYLASRIAMTDGTPDVDAPAGLAELLSGLHRRVWRVLFTNAPEHGVAATLRHIGVADHIDLTITDAGKPDGWTRLLPALLTHRTAQRVLSVGDLWANDIAQPLAAGTCTALIDRFAHRAGPAHAIGAHFPALYPAVRAWAADPAAFAAAHRPEPESAG